MIEYDKFQKSLKLLEEQNKRLQGLFDNNPDWIIDAVKESIIQRFETCYDCMWKVLKRYLAEELGIPEVPNSPKPILRLGYENNLFASSLEQWLSYADARTATAHDYSGEKAEDCLELMSDFVDDAIGLYQTLSGDTWQ